MTSSACPRTELPQSGSRPQFWLEASILGSILGYLFNWKLIQLIQVIQATNVPSFVPCARKRQRPPAWPRHRSSLGRPRTGHGPDTDEKDVDDAPSIYNSIKFKRKHYATWCEINPDIEWNLHELLVLNQCFYQEMSLVEQTWFTGAESNLKGILRTMARELTIRRRLWKMACSGILS